MQRKRVGLLVSYFDVRVHRGVAEFARAHGWILDAHPHDPTRWPGVCEGDGVLFLGRENEVPEVVRNFSQPAVNLGRSLEPERYPEVRTDAEGIGRRAADHLMRCGLQRFSGVFTADAPSMQERKAAFVERLSEAGREYLDLPVFLEDWARHFRHWLARVPKPLGLLAENDEEAQWIVQLCRYLTLSVPEEVALLGVGDEPLISELSEVPLSSVDSNAFGKGYEAARLLDRWIATGEKPSPVTFVPAKGVVARASTDVFHADRPELRAALECIQTNFRWALHLEDLAAQTGLSGRRLQDLIKMQTGKTFKTLLLEKRLEEAERLLGLGQLKLQAVASECGFKSDAHLCQVFRRERGTTPGEYRRRG